MELSPAEPVIGPRFIVQPRGLRIGVYAFCVIDQQRNRVVCSSDVERVMIGIAKMINAQHEAFKRQREEAH